MSSLVNVSEAAYLALHSLALIAKNENKQRLNVKKIANILQASQAHLAKVFQKLAKAGLVKSVRGPAGGFELLKSPEHISFWEIYEIIEGKFDINGCPFGKTTCAFKRCIFSNEISRISVDIYETFNKITLANFELFKQQEKK